MQFFVFTRLVVSANQRAPLFNQSASICFNVIFLYKYYDIAKTFQSIN